MKNTLSRLSNRLGFAASAIPLPPYRSPESKRSLKWTVLGRRRSVPHIGRKLYHMTMGTMCFALYAFILDRQGALMALAGVGGTFVILDLIRLRFPRANDLTLRLFGSIMRREELKRLSGNSYFVLGLLLVTFVFPKSVVLLSVLYLAWGDPIAAIVGTLYGRRRLAAGKSLEGALANMAVSGALTFLVALLYFHWQWDRAIVIAGLGGVISMLSEIAPIPVDDNFSIPVLSATLLSLVFFALNV
jgi:diacylglycerol kinase (CTP)